MYVQVPPQEKLSQPTTLNGTVALTTNRARQDKQGSHCPSDELDKFGESSDDSEMLIGVVGSQFVVASA